MGRFAGSVLTRRDSLLEKYLGTGLAASLTLRGAAWLWSEVRNRDDERVASVRLQPGETYTVVARPRASKEERRLAARVASLEAAERRMSRPDRSQRRAAIRLARAQRRLARRAPDSRRYAKAAAAEARLGDRFDRAFAPTRKHAKVLTRLDAARVELDTERERSLAEARSRRSRSRRSARRESVRVDIP